jgi:hypothetical protein
VIRRGTGPTLYLPAERLSKAYASRYGWDQDKLVAVLSTFGPLSETGQEQLIRCLVLAFGRYQLATAKRVTLSVQRDHLKAIETSAGRLLSLLGVDPKKAAPRLLSNALSDQPSSMRLRYPGSQIEIGVMATMWLSIAGITTTGRDETDVNTQLAKASDQVADAAMAVLSLHQRAKIAVEVTTKRIRPGRGGPRRAPPAKGQLVRDAFAIYAHIREQHPDSGNQPALGGPMVRFVRAVAALCGAGVQDADVRDAWRLWKSSQK